MRTTLDIEDALLIAARELAAREGRTLTATVEAALRRMLYRDEAPGDFTFEPIVKGGTEPPPIDVANRDQLFDLLDG